MKEISKAISQFETVTQDNLDSFQRVHTASTGLRAGSEKLQELINGLIQTVEGRNDSRLSQPILAQAHAQSSLDSSDLDEAA